MKLRRDGKTYRRVIALLPEGLGFEMTERLGELVANQWKDQGSPKDTLFLVGGEKSYDDGHVIDVLDNLHNRKVRMPFRTECFMLYEALTLWGVPRSQILWENQSHNTAEQKVEFDRLLRQATTDYSGGVDLTIVCHSLHAYRARKIFEYQSPFRLREVWSVKYKPDPTQPRNSGNWFQRLPSPLYAVLEVAVIVRNKKDGLF